LIHTLHNITFVTGQVYLTQNYICRKRTSVTCYSNSG